MADWSEENVELMTKLWMEGLSASQIAITLGNGFTKNAVIGKIHRLKISSTGTRPARSKSPSLPKPKMKPAGTPKTSHTSRVKRDSLNSSIKRFDSFESKLYEEAFPEISFLLPATNAFGASEAIQDLKPSCCKFPIGDALEKDFRFCGAEAREKEPYCEYHHGIAYQGRLSRSRDNRKLA